MPLPFVALLGPTASGKTEAGIALAEQRGAEIASVDSMLVYRGMDIGTAKPTTAQRVRVPHHLIDLADPDERFTVARFQAIARDVTSGLAERRVPVLLVGGSGLYLRAVVDDLAIPPEDPAVREELEREAAVLGPERLYQRLQRTDPAAALKIEPGNARRVVRALEVAAITGRRFSSFGAAWDVYDPARLRAAGIRMEPTILAARIAERVSAMFAAGWIEEVRGLVEHGWGSWLTSTQAIGYSELVGHLDGRLGLDEAWERTTARTRNLARRQMAWFRRDPRIRWFDVGSGGAMDVVGDVQAYLEGA
ncbi:MAG TPA: tRNA (adenosine(37)-N6)-dimethylallyltransferase MiaA [Actinomycetota bacterium]